MAFSAQQIQSVWEKGITVDKYDNTKYRQDVAGAWMQRDKYGDHDSGFGWDIDHVYPESKGGKDDLDNLRPMQWENNQSKNADYPTYKTVKSSDGNKNIAKEENYTVNEQLQALLKKLYNIK